MESISEASPGYEYVSTKTYCHNIGLSCAFRQWRAESHCKYLHGYALQVRLEFTAGKLDVRNWVVDFGSLKAFKQILENTLDHKTLVAIDDPMYKQFCEMHQNGIINMVSVQSTGCEATARMIFEVAEQWLKDAGYNSITLDSVEVSEHEGNSAKYRKIRYG